MNYRHGYHAGNFADVVKHVTLIALIDSLARKDTPYCYIDTHAGTGHYNLMAEFAQKSKEYVGGIEKVIHAANPPELIKRYLHCVHTINNKLSAANYAALEFYPGSPMFVQFLMRGRDRLIACELQPQEYQTLKTVFANNKQVAVHHMDGFWGLKAFLPPQERRGLVLIDPPYEDPDEFNRIAHTLPIALKRWETGIYAIWYPIKEMTQLKRFYNALKSQIKQPIFVIELTIHPDLPHHLNGCGIAVINPPWQFDLAIQAVLPWLWEALAINKQGGFRAYEL